MKNADLVKADVHRVFASGPLAKASLGIILGKQAASVTRIAKTMHDRNLKLQYFGELPVQIRAQYLTCDKLRCTRCAACSSSGKVLVL